VSCVVVPIASRLERHLVGGMPVPGNQLDREMPSFPFPFPRSFTDSRHAARRARGAASQGSGDRGARPGAPLFLST